jgi:succinate dehydrogenase/fumarate reductase flavoprotein subunit
MTVIEAAEVDRWDDSADVIVVGFGMAGVCAALEARDAGADVLVLEAASGSGGTTAAATGHFYLGGGTPVQQACGFEDTAAQMYAYLMATSVDPQPEKTRLYCDNSVAHFHWLERQGIPFERSYFPWKAVAQPGPECLIWTGNEKVAPFRDLARPAPRGHKVAVADPETGGGRAMQVFTARAAEMAVRAQFNARANALVRHEGRIVGARYVTAGKAHHLHARRGVVLAAGGFGQNEEMLREHIPDMLDERVVRIAGANDSGDGIKLGIAAGAATRHMNGAFLSTYYYPPEQLLKGIIVNAAGQRFVAEDSYHARTAAFILAQERRQAWLIVDAATFAWPLYTKTLGIDLVDGWEDIPSVEQGLSLPQGSLEATLSSYNRAAAQGQDSLGKHPDWLKPFDSGPYAAFDLSFGRVSYRAFTLGGLRVSIDGEVMKEDDTVIPGLYAAGACASNLAQEGLSYASGTCLGTASFFGRRAGRHAARIADKHITSQ